MSNEQTDQREMDAAKRIEDLEAIVAQVREVARSGMLPDGDGINVPTGIWLDELFGLDDEEVR